jgi:hypothetical protein
VVGGEGGDAIAAIFGPARNRPFDAFGGHANLKKGRGEE